VVEQAAADETRVRSALTAAGIEVLAIEPLEPSLEDVFMELVAGAGNGANEELPAAETSREG